MAIPLLRNLIADNLTERFFEGTVRVLSPEPLHFCTFCNEPAGVATKYFAKGWRLCARPSCNAAAAAQAERIYAGLVDCPETRADALRWVKART